MKTILSVMFAMMVGLTFAGSTFAGEKKTDATTSTPGGAVGTDMKQGDTTKKADEGKTTDKDSKKKKDKNGEGKAEKH
jgi:hypothetical protein